MSILTANYRTRQSVLGYPIDLIDEQSALEIVEDSWNKAKSLHVVTLNAEMVIGAQEDEVLDRIIRRAHLIVPDGAGVVFALRLYGHKVNRLPGIELSGAILKLAAQKSRKVALIGGKPQVIESLKVILPTTYPGLTIAASRHGYYSPTEEEAIVNQLAAASPDLVLVALGVPKQEYFIDRWQGLFPSATMIGVGGSFDVWAGVAKRAPLFFRETNLEWLYRLIAEPWRYKRMGAALPSFAFQVLREFLKTGISKNDRSSATIRQRSAGKKHEKGK